jgi:hypothetical protein
MKLRVKKVHSYSTFPKIVTIVSSMSSFFMFQNTIGRKIPSRLSGWIVIMQGFHGNFIIGLHGGHKKIRLMLK